MRQKNERRYARRVSLEPPQPGTLSSFKVSVVDLSTSGARIQHTCPMAFQPGKRFILEFDCDGDHLRLTCVVTRSRLDGIDAEGTVYTTGVRFVDLTSSATERLWGLIGELEMNVVAHESSDTEFAVVNG
jgi:hypothetical protein